MYFLSLKPVPQTPLIFLGTPLTGLDTSVGKSIEVGNAELTTGGGTSPAPHPRPNGRKGTIPAPRKGTIPAPPGALAAVKRKTKAGEDGVEDSDEDWDRVSLQEIYEV